MVQDTSAPPEVTATAGSAGAPSPLQPPPRSCGERCRVAVSAASQRGHVVAPLRLLPVTGRVALTGAAQPPGSCRSPVAVPWA